MNADQLPLNQPIIMSSTNDIRVTATRINSDWVELVYNDQKTNDEILKVLARVDGTATELVALDRLYWNIVVNNRPVTELDFQDIIRKTNISFSVNPNTRVIAITVL